MSLVSETWRTILDALAGVGPAEYLAIVVVLAVVSQWAAWQVRLPSILILLLIGFGLGQVIAPEDVLGRDVLFGGVTIAVGVILFEGALSLRLRHVRDLGKPVWRLCSVTVLVAWALITAAALLVGFAFEVALLVGAILVVTGPTVIAPILRSLRPTRRIASLLRWEGIVVDPIGAVLAVLVFTGVLAGGGGDAVGQIVLTLGATIVVAFGIALVLGWTLTQLMLRHAIPDFLHGVTFLAAAVGAMVGSNAVQSESGLLTVTVLGVYLGNQPRLHLEHVAEFSEHLQVLLVGILFIVLAGRISPSQLADVAVPALVFLALLVVVVRPVSIALGLWGTKVTSEEKRLLAFMAPRGIVAAAVTSIFALEFAHAAESAAAAAQDASGERAQELLATSEELSRLATEAGEMVPLVFIVIVCTVAIYGLGVGRLAERLGLASTTPQGIIFVGGQQWVVDAAKMLEEQGITTLLVSRDYAKLARARMAGLTTETANILSDYAVKDMDLAGMGSLIACTDSDEVNATAAREFAHVLGRAGVYQVRRTEENDVRRDRRRQAAGHLSAQSVFLPSRTHEEMASLVASGMQVKRTRLTEEFDLDAFLAHYGEETVLMFTLRDGEVTVLHSGSKPPRSGVTVVALVRERDEVTPPSTS
ncbi:cation:proton antiporter [Nocardioides sp. AE5]|uniref:cation:proton antiporter n=1 Tax=Nocardioides sp. AE5 TaxID=2962573 RepID=UPI0028814B36|nr:cation:proton antiporter [Nocardioides sp. AE5]MDT0201324.1 cation:proton antiporter [Nocardioides sp. AE5]